MTSLLQLLLIALIFGCQFVSFGWWLVKVFRLKQLNLVEQLVIGTLLSFAIHSSLFFLLGLLTGPAIYYLSLISLAIGLRQLKSLLKAIALLWKKVKTKKLIAIFSITAALTLATTLTFSWIMRDHNLVFQAGQLHDSVWHIALINRLVANIPPEHPSDFTLIVTNYHYFYDLIIAGWNKVFFLPIPLIYFQFMPLVISLLLSAGAASLGKRLGGLICSAYLVFLTFFAGSLAYLIPLFIKGNTWHESSFWVSQTFSMMLNPQLILSLAVLYGVVVLLFSIKDQKTNSLGSHFILLLLITNSLGLKSYAFVILSILYTLFVFHQAIRHRSWRYLWLILGLIISSLPLMGLITGFKTSSFIFLPLWFLDSMVESPDRLNFIPWTLLKEHYLFKQAWHRLLWLRFREVVIFYVGNLGIRSLGLLLPILLIFKKMNHKDFYYLIWGGFIISSTIPLFFIQQGIVWNTIQFWYYSLIFSNILAAKLFSVIHYKLASGSVLNKAVLGVFLLIIIGLALPTYIKTAQIKYFNTEAFSANELAVLAEIEETDLVVVHPNLNRYYQSSIIAAYTNASLVRANPVQLQIAGISTSDEEEKKLIQLIEQQPEELVRIYPNVKLLSDKPIKRLKQKPLSSFNNELFLYSFAE
jgi:hypothetical protein